MTYSTGMRSAVCLAALIAGGAANADVTAAQVWEDWKAQLALYGEDNLTIGAEETSSGVLTVRDLSLRMMNFRSEANTLITYVDSKDTPAEPGRPIEAQLP
ncbi:MAG: hypothetical protein AAFN63_18775, partial [Pseudomonadota bacterium]